METALSAPGARALEMRAAGDDTPNRKSRKGFFTDSTLCIGCKACEVACKQWNQLPEDGFDFTAMSYDNTGGLGASTWRHVAFIERPVAHRSHGVRHGFCAARRLQRLRILRHRVSLRRHRASCG